MEANDTCKGCLRVEAPPTGATVARKHNRLWPARRGDSRPRAQPLAAWRSQGLPPMASPVANKGGCPLAGWLPTGKGSRRLGRGSDGDVEGKEG
ncbi:hypothetical protein B296_00014794 [Ensete ventricosum]|uniref:Uncharacterized protein n=1 Tax=Ensete ventricosum TaxID=4639 RepID=A0A426ZQ12_ENSVE|nr:hypothetical protein B296_00014794 [Ensete ventricosum]